MTTALKTVAERIPALIQAGLTPELAAQVALQEYATESATLAAIEKEKTAQADALATAAASNVWDFHGMKVSGGKTPSGQPGKFAKAAENAVVIVPAQLATDSKGFNAYFPPCVWVGLKGSQPQMVTSMMVRALSAYGRSAGADNLLTLLNEACGPEAMAAYEAEKSKLIDAGTLPKPGKKN